MQQEQQRIVHLFVYDTFSDWEPAYAIAAINNPAWQVRYRVRTVGVNREPVKTIGGLTIIPDMSLEELTPEQSAMLILTGGDGWTDGKRAQALECARAFLEAGVPVAAICGAVDGLACAGLLDDRRHTGNVIDELRATGYQGEALYQQERAFTDGDLITAGVTAPLEFAYHILKRLEVYPPDALEAWYSLFKTGDPVYHFALMRAFGVGM